MIAKGESLSPDGLQSQAREHGEVEVSLPTEGLCMMFAAVFLALGEDW